ncbi:MAG: hypothetical protein KC492_20030 [Myxococcales bacterium]|nr:hypothetical protein [Myxococcales bacterium]
MRDPEIPDEIKSAILDHASLLMFRMELNAFERPNEDDIQNMVEEILRRALHLVDTQRLINVHQRAVVARLLQDEIQRTVQSMVDQIPLKERPFLDVVLHPDLTPEQQLAALNALGELYTAAGGQDLLEIVDVQEFPEHVRELAP